MNILIEKNDGAKIVWHILEIANLLKKYGDFICQQENVTCQQWLVLLHLGGDPNIPYFERDHHEKPMLASELAEALSVSRPNITNLLNTLMQKGLITQVEDFDDRRRKRLKLAPEGKALLARLEPGRKLFNKKLLEKLNIKEESEFLRFLSYCNQTIHEHFSEFAHK